MVALCPATRSHRTRPVALGESTAAACDKLTTRIPEPLIMSGSKTGVVTGVLSGILTCDGRYEQL
jgi:hypothetical protein